MAWSQGYQLFDMCSHIYKWGCQKCRALWHLCFLKDESGLYCAPCSYVHLKNAYTFRNKILHMPTAMPPCNLQLQRISPEWQLSSAVQDELTNSGHKTPFSSTRAGTQHIKDFLLNIKPECWELKLFKNEWKICAGAPSASLEINQIFILTSPLQVFLIK